MKCCVLHAQWALLLALAALVGCQQQAPPATDPAALNTVSDLGAPAGIPSGTPVGAAVQNAPLPAPEDPDVAVNTALAAFQEGKLHLAFDFLPPSYQTDIDKLVQSFAGKMDPEVWGATFTVLRKGVEVLKTKRDFVLQLVPPAGPNATPQDAALEEVKKNWDGLVQALDVLVNSDVSQLDRMQQFSTRQYIAATGNQLFSQVQTLAAATGQNQLAELSQVKINVIRRDAAKATLSMQGPKDAVPTEYEFARVEGRWVPQTLVDDWAKNIERAQDELAKITTEQLAAQKPQTLAALQGLEDTLDGMLAAQKPEDFQATVFPLILQFGMLGQALTPPKAPPGSVTLTFSTALTDEQQTQVAKQLEQLTDDPEKATYTMSTGTDQTTITLQPVADVAAFAEKLTFVTAKSVDAGKRSIELELKPE
jgi:hypothetical protein